MHTHIALLIVIENIVDYIIILWLSIIIMNKNKEIIKSLLTQAGITINGDKPFDKKYTMKSFTAVF